MSIMQNLSDTIFNIKDKITDGEFKEIMDLLKEINDNENEIVLKRCLVVIPSIKFDSNLTPIIKNCIMDKRVPFYIKDIEFVKTAIEEYGYICYDRFNNNMFLNDNIDEDSNNIILTQTPIILKLIGDNFYINENSNVPPIAVTDIDDTTIGD
tara:strand:+ start:591 stop:1049 length:459 start_codon:yes stop_codon:yes gene_type:complete